MEPAASPWRPIEIERRLEGRLGCRVALSVLPERALLTVLPGPGFVRVRLGLAFVHAPAEVLDAVAVYSARPHDLGARGLLDRFLRAAAGLPVEVRSGEDGGGARTDAVALEAVPRLPASGGRYHDLEAICEELNRRFFEGRVTARIRWSRGTPHRRRRSILFGSFRRFPGDPVGLIQIHPALDEAWVPVGFVAFVVHHELLHAVVPTRTIEGRRAFHPPEFHARERLYPDFERWRRWEKENLGRFLGRIAISAR